MSTLNWTRIISKHNMMMFVFLVDLHTRNCGVCCHPCSSTSYTNFELFQTCGPSIGKFYLVRHSVCLFCMLYHMMKILNVAHDQYWEVPGWWWCKMVPNEMTISLSLQCGWLGSWCADVVEVTKAISYMHHLAWYQHHGALAPCAMLLHGLSIMQDLAGASHGQWSCCECHLCVQCIQYCWVVYVRHGTTHFWHIFAKVQQMQRCIDKDINNNNMPWCF